MVVDLVFANVEVNSLWGVGVEVSVQLVSVSGGEWPVGEWGWR